MAKKIKEEDFVGLTSEEKSKLVLKKIGERCRILSGKDYKDDVKTLSTGSLSLDQLLVKPLPPGIHELAGHFR